jgi:hypothetical protein
MKKLLNNNYDLTGSETLRISKTYILSRFIPLGNFNSGPNLRCLLVFALLHYFSGAIFWIMVRQERLVTGLLSRMKNIVQRMR